MQSIILGSFTFTCKVLRACKQEKLLYFFNVVNVTEWEKREIDILLMSDSMDTLLANLPLKKNLFLDLCTNSRVKIQIAKAVNLRWINAQNLFTYCSLNVNKVNKIYGLDIFWLLNLIFYSLRSPPINSAQRKKDWHATTPNLNFLGNFSLQETRGRKIGVR